MFDKIVKLNTHVNVSNNIKVDAAANINTGDKEMSEEMHRDFCPRCAIKHLGKAAILMKEAKLGYPHHVWYAMSNMSEAEDEIVDRMPEEAEKIRTERLKIQDLLAGGKFLYKPNFTDLMYLVAAGGMLEEVADLDRVDESGEFKRWEDL